MAGKREKPEDIVLKLRQVEVLQGQGKPVSEAVRQIGVTIQTYYRWRKERALSAIGPRTMASAV
jgi:putative transposase